MFEGCGVSNYFHAQITWRQDYCIELVLNCLLLITAGAFLFTEGGEAHWQQPALSLCTLIRANPSSSACRSASTMARIRTRRKTAHLSVPIFDIGLSTAYAALFTLAACLIYYRLLIRKGIGVMKKL